MITFIIKADTPEDTKAQIVKWLRDQAINHSVGSRLAERKKVAHDHKTKADAYTSAADFIELIKIEPKLPPVGEILGSYLGLDESKAKDQ